MKPWFYIPLLLLCLLKAPNAHAQNLVPNHSFEEYSECPTGPSQIEKAIGWMNFGVRSGSPDYFHTCATDSIQNSHGWFIAAGVPENSFGYQHAKEGLAYAGVCTYNPDLGSGDPFREIIGIELIKPLEVGKKYYVSFWVSPGFGNYAYATIFSNKIGARFSMHKYDGHWQSTNPAPVDNFAHIYTDSIITDTSEWHLISGTFIADMPYPYLMLGNFFDNAHTDTITEIYFIGLLTAYYYIDDVCVSSSKDDCPLFDPVIDTTQENNDDCLEAPIHVFPNPTADDALLTFNCQWEKWVRIFDATGRLIHQQTLPEEADQYQMDCSRWAKGMYLVVVEWNNQRQSVKLIVQ